MRNLGLLALLCTTLSYSALELAEAAPPGSRARPGFDGRAPGGERGDRRERFERLETQVLEHVKGSDATRYKALIELKNKRPRAYRHLLMKAGRSLRHVKKDASVEKRFYRAFDLTVKMGDLADGYDSLSPSKQAQRRSQITDVARQMYELRQHNQRARLEAMEARLNKVRAELAAKDAAKEQIVDDMVQRILTPKRDRKRRPR